MVKKKKKSIHCWQKKREPLSLMNHIYTQEKVQEPNFISQIKICTICDSKVKPLEIKPFFQGFFMVISPQSETKYVVLTDYRANVNVNVIKKMELELLCPEVTLLSVFSFQQLYSYSKSMLKPGYSLIRLLIFRMSLLFLYAE